MNRDLVEEEDCKHVSLGSSATERNNKGFGGSVSYPTRPWEKQFHALNIMSLNMPVLNMKDAF